MQLIGLSAPGCIYPLVILLPTVWFQRVYRKVASAYHHDTVIDPAGKAGRNTLSDTRLVGRESMHDDQTVGSTGMCAQPRQ